MDKKTLSIVLSVLIVAVGIVYFNYQGDVFSGGIRGDSVMGMMEKQGGVTESKSAYINECKESDKEERDICYGMGAFYYRDASFCKLMEDAETRSNCNQENIEKWYGGLKENGASGFPGMMDLSNLGRGTSPNEEIVPDGEITTQPEVKTELPKLSEKVTEEVCVDVMAYTDYGSHLVLTEKNMYAAVPIQEKLDALETKYGITEENIMEVCGATFEEPDFMEKVLKRMQELGYKGTE